MLKDQLHLHWIVFIWGFTAILGEEIHLASIQLVFYRTLLTVLFMWMLVKWRKENIQIDTTRIWKFIATGCVIGAHWTLFFAAAKVSKISVCLAGMATASLFTAFLEPLLNKTKVKPYEILLGLLVISGLYTIFHFEFDHALGLLLALASAFLAALFSVINGQFAKVEKPVVITYFEMIGAFGFCALCIPFFSDSINPTAESLWLLQLPSYPEWGYLVILSLVCTVYPFSATVQLQQRMTAFNVNLIVNMEPVYGIVLAYLIYGKEEQMSGGFYLGTLIILCAVVIYPIIGRVIKTKKVKESTVTIN